MSLNSVLVSREGVGSSVLVRLARRSTYTPTAHLRAVCIAAVAHLDRINNLIKIHDAYTGSLPSSV